MASATGPAGRMNRYDELLTQALRVAYAIAPDSAATSDAEQPPAEEEMALFGRLILNVPYLTPNAIEILSQYCTDEVRAFLNRHLLSPI